MGQQSEEIAAINRLIDKYTEAETAMDHTTQGKLMAADRTWISMPKQT